MPDIVAIIGGQYVGIEVKRPGGKQTPQQKYFETQSTKAGAKYWLVTSLEEVKNNLNLWQK